ncbi:MAG: hypothetical protein MUE59_06180 [Thiobacillaceae bacterium]|jgi:hypothetical protein|nr:hypothetical protein [Thiobacillaceae bacterium]
MTVESATYIADLNTSNPAGSDAKSEGDNHIRLIKSVLKSTFANVNAAVTSSDEELNYVDVTTLGTMQASKALTADGSNVATVPSGGTLTAASGSTVNLAGTTVVTGNITADSKTITPAELGTLDGITTSSTIATQLAAKLTSTPTFGIQFSLDAGADGDYTLDQYATHGYTVNSAVYQTASGTIAAAVKKNGSALTGLSALSLTSSEGGPTSSGASLSPGDTLSVTLSSNSSATKVSIKLNCTRA